MPRGAVGELLLHQAELADGFAKGLAVDGVADGLIERHLGGSQRGRAQFVAADVEDVEGDVMALADLAQQVGRGNHAVGEDEWAGGRAANAQLVLLLADGEAGRAAFDEEGGELFFSAPGTTHLAKTVKRSAMPALVIHIFSPFRM